MRFFLMASLLGCVFGGCASSMLFAQNSDAVALRTAHLTRTERDEIASIVIEPLKANGGVDPNGPSAHAIALNSWVSFVNVSSTKARVVQVSNGPDNPDVGATGNGDVWLFRLVGGHARMILAGGGSGYGAVSAGYHHGMRDYETFWNMSCCDGNVEVYRYNGMRYKPLYCYEQTFDKDGKAKTSVRSRCNDQ